MVNKKEEVIVSKSTAYEKKIVLSCNLVYQNDDSFVLHYDLLNWMEQNITDKWDIIEHDTYITFIFSNKSDAVHFTLVYC